jgi:hypothetical protein
LHIAASWTAAIQQKMIIAKPTIVWKKSKPLIEIFFRFPMSRQAAQSFLSGRRVAWR